MEKCFSSIRSKLNSNHSDQLEEGSVGSVVHYMLDKLGIGDSLEPEILANEIRSYLMVE